MVVSRIFSLAIQRTMSIMFDQQNMQSLSWPPKLADASRCKCISATMWQQLYRYHNQHWGIPMIFQPCLTPCPQFSPKLQRQCCATTAAAMDRWPTARWPRSTAPGRWMPRTSLDILGSCWGTPKMQALNTWENAGKLLGKCMENAWNATVNGFTGNYKAQWQSCLC